MQEDKEGLFDAEKTVKSCLAIYAEMMRQIVPDVRRMEEAAAEDFTCATDVADYLAKKGVPFRTAHGIVGGIVRECLEKGKTLDSLSLGEYKAHSPVFEADILDVVKARNSADSRNSVGGSSVSAAPRRNPEHQKSGWQNSLTEPAASLPRGILPPDNHVPTVSYKTAHPRINRGNLRKSG